MTTETRPEFDAVVLGSMKPAGREAIPTTEILWGCRGLSMLLSRIANSGDTLNEGEQLAFASALEVMTQLLVERHGTVPTAAEEALQEALEATIYAPVAGATAETE